MIARLSWIQAACLTSCGPSTARPMSRTRHRRTVAPGEHQLSYSGALLSWSVASTETERFGPSSVPLGALAVAVPSAARTCSRLRPECVQLARVDLHADGGLLLAVQVDQADAADARQLLRDVGVGVDVHLLQRQHVRSHGDRHDLEIRRVGLSQVGGLGSVRGSSAGALLMAACTSCAAASMLRLRSNCTAIEVLPWHCWKSSP